MAKRIDVESLAALENLVAALETEDVLGAALRAQLQVEQTIEVFLEATVAEGMWDVVPALPQHFGQKITLAAALGFPKELCFAATALNQVRNKFAHRAGWSVKEADIENLVNKYESARVALDPAAYEMRTSAIRIYSRGGARIDFGTNGPEWDFKMVAGGIVSLIVKYLVQQNFENGFGPE